MIPQGFMSAAWYTVLVWHGICYGYPALVKFLALFYGIMYLHRESGLVFQPLHLGPLGLCIWIYRRVIAQLAYNQTSTLLAAQAIHTHGDWAAISLLLDLTNMSCSVGNASYVHQLQCATR